MHFDSLPQDYISDMKKLILVVFLLPVMVVAQQPFGYNATWHFTYSAFGYNGYKQVSYNRDSVINGQTWQVFTVTGLSELRTGPGPNDIIQDTNVVFPDVMLSTRNDSVFYMDAQNAVHPLYDFNAGVGDKWRFAYPTTTLGCYAMPEATVTSIGYDTINGLGYKYWEITNPMDTFIIQNQKFYMCASGYCLPTKIYQHIGTNWHSELFTPSPNICNGNSITLAYHQLRCFSNGSINVNFTQKACDYWSLISVDEYALAQTKIYPNPTEKAITIQSEKPIELVEIYSLQGQKLGETTFTERIELPEAAGVYLLSIHFNNGFISTQKVVKQ